MLKKMFVTAAAAAAVSVPLAGVASAAPGGQGDPNGNGIGPGGIPARATATVADQLSDLGVDQTVIDAIAAANQSGKSGVVAPGSAYSLGAKTPCQSASGPVKCNAPDGYGAALNAFYFTPIADGGLVGASVDNPLVNPFNPGEEFGSTIPGSVTRAFTPGCAQHSTGVCLEPTP